MYHGSGIILISIDKQTWLTYAITITYIEEAEQGQASKPYDLHARGAYTSSEKCDDNVPDNDTTVSGSYEIVVTWEVKKCGLFSAWLLSVSLIACIYRSRL